MHIRGEPVMIETNWSSDDILVSRQGHVGVVIFNRPEKRNAFTARMWADLPELVRRLDEDDSIRLVIFRGGGDTAFSAGADISEFEEVFGSVSNAMTYNQNVGRAQRVVEQMSKPTLALVYGSCVGGGCGLALACDLRFAADDARFGITPSRLGTALSLPDTRRLVALVGPGHAKDILFSARLISAHDALAIGLVNQVLPADKLEVAVADYAEMVIRNSPTSIRIMKAMINSLTGVCPVPDTELDRQFQQSFHSDDFKEGVAAFLEKRPPRF